MLHAFARWLHEHARFFEVTLVILSALVAFYADTVRHFLSLPPQKLSTWILKARLLSVNSKLFNLCECQNNAFSTLVYVSRFLVFVLLLTSLFIGGIFLEVVSIRVENRGDPGVYSRFHANHGHNAGFAVCGGGLFPTAAARGISLSPAKLQGIRQSSHGARSGTRGKTWDFRYYPGEFNQRLMPSLKEVVRRQKKRVRTLISAFRPGNVEDRYRVVLGVCSRLPLPVRARQRRVVLVFGPPRGEHLECAPSRRPARPEGLEQAGKCAPATASAGRRTASLPRSRESQQYRSSWFCITAHTCRCSV